MLAENKAQEQEQTIASLSPVIKVHLSSRKAIFELLKDMRPVLNRLNESNPNIVTYPLASIQVQNLEVAQASWLDLCGTHFCFYSETVNAYLKFPLEEIMSSRVAGGKNQFVEVLILSFEVLWILTKSILRSRCLLHRRLGRSFLKRKISPSTVH